MFFKSLQIRHLRAEGAPLLRVAELHSSEVREDAGPHRADAGRVPGALHRGLLGQVPGTEVNR